MINVRGLQTFDLILLDTLGPPFELRERFDTADLIWLPNYLARTVKPRSDVRVTLNGVPVDTSA